MLFHSTHPSCQRKHAQPRNPPTRRMPRHQYINISNQSPYPRITIPIIVRLSIKGLGSVIHQSVRTDTTILNTSNREDPVFMVPLRAISILEMTSAKGFFFFHDSSANYLQLLLAISVGILCRLRPPSENRSFTIGATARTVKRKISHPKVFSPYWILFAQNILIDPVTFFSNKIA